MKMVVAALIAIGTPATVAAQLTGQVPTGYINDQIGRGGGMLAGLSPVGRATMRAALRGVDAQGDHASTEAARDRMRAALEADRLDSVALKRAMDDERESVNAAKTRHQAAMLAGFQQLSATDRKAFVATARMMRARMGERTAALRGPRSGNLGALPPPSQ
jgi:uncharacterized membrane protein